MSQEKEFPVEESFVGGGSTLDSSGALEKNESAKREKAVGMTLQSISEEPLPLMPRAPTTVAAEGPSNVAQFEHGEGETATKSNLSYWMLEVWDRAWAALKFIICLSVIAGIAIGYNWDTLSPWLEKKKLDFWSPTVPSLVILSEPEGALVEIDGKIVGVTPLAQDNRYAQDRVSFRLSKDGYVSSAGIFRGKQPEQISMTLKKKPAFKR